MLQLKVRANQENIKAPQVPFAYGNKESPLKNPKTTSIARLNLRFRRTGIASVRYATYWFLAVFA
ncbi:hypothetical protein, partial [Xanthomonas oryzae]|uniref:hypothetical protein n=1 Tax=Xanthomonas oryzae TaxID=347 RepID=UPI003CE54AA2